MKTNEPFASIKLCHLDHDLVERLRVRAAEHGRSIEIEAICILEAALAMQAYSAGQHLYERVQERFASLGGVDLDLPSRQAFR